MSSRGRAINKGTGSAANAASGEKLKSVLRAGMEVRKASAAKTAAAVEVPFRPDYGQANGTRAPLPHKPVAEVRLPTEGSAVESAFEDLKNKNLI